LCRRRWLRNEKRLAYIRAEERLRGIAPRRIHPLTIGAKKQKLVRTISPPSVLDLEGNYSATIQFFKNIRFATNALNGKFLVDLKVVDEISPAAALLMVAEFDRWREKTPLKWLRAVDAGDWTPSVRRRLKEMGFFEVLGTRNLPEDEYVPGEDRYVPFLTGSRSVGQPARDLRERIEAIGQDIVDSSALYDGLVEAMTNVKQHAYQGKQGLTEEPQRWWISASVNMSHNKMTVMVVDHGAGIARTLPRSSKWEKIRMALPLKLLKDDAKILEAAFAMEAGNRSQTREEFRGKGLRENIKGYVESHNSRGQLHVIANHARYRFVRDSSTMNEEEGSVRLPVPFGGTFIEWIIEDYGQQPDDRD
jgi:hypothetical protein